MSDQTADDGVLRIDVERGTQMALVHCHGRLVGGVSAFFFFKISQLIPESKRIVLDLSDLQHTDSMGLGTLVHLYVSAKAADCSLELVNLSQQAQRLIGITNLSSVLTIIGESDIKFA